MKTTKIASNLHIFYTQVHKKFRDNQYDKISLIKTQPTLIQPENFRPRPNQPSQNYKYQTK